MSKSSRACLCWITPHYEWTMNYSLNLYLSRPVTCWSPDGEHFVSVWDFIFYRIVYLPADMTVHATEIPRARNAVSFPVVRLCSFVKFAVACSQSFSALLFWWASCRRLAGWVQGRVGAPGLINLMWASLISLLICLIQIRPQTAAHLLYRPLNPEADRLKRMWRQLCKYFTSRNETWCLLLSWDRYCV